MEDKPAEYKETIEDQLNQIVYLLYALLAMSIVISLFGIANSLFLSIHERTREFGVLRAIGATTDQVRRVIRYESVITAVIGRPARDRRGHRLRLAGTNRALSEFGFSLAIPVGQLVVFMLSRCGRRRRRRDRAGAPGGAHRRPSKRSASESG